MHTNIRQPDRQSPRHLRSHHAGTVLIVEDQRALSEMLASMLQSKWQCKTLVAASLAEAQSQLEAHGNDVFAAICDVNLPDAPYGEVIDHVARQRIPAIALTGTINRDIRQMMTQGHIVDYVLKKGILSFEYVVQWVGRLMRNSGMKVLVADDSPSSLEIMRRMLHMHGFNVHTAKNGQEALVVLREHPDIKLALVDYNMPLVDGFEFVTEARRLMGKERLAIIGISGENRSEVSAQFLKNGANDFISKPYSFEEMTCRINQNLEMIELMESLHHLANVDALTGLFNRRYFFEQGNLRHQHAKKSGKPVVVAMLDIDHFKSINDRFGHAQGDVVIRYVAEGLKKHFPDGLVARIGGEEFAIFFDEQPVFALRERLDVFRQQLPSHDLDNAPADMHISISIGVDGVSTANLNSQLQAADKRLYEAKAKGRNRVEG